MCPSCANLVSKEFIITEQADSQPKSSGLVLGRRPLGAILHSSNEPGELSQWLCHDDSTINIVVLIIIIIIVIIIHHYTYRNVGLSPQNHQN